jgi:SRSO17 transposase
MAEHLIDAREQSSLNRFLNESDWGCDIHTMELNKIALMQRYRQTAITSQGSIIIDDTLLEKTGSSMDLVQDHFDHCSFKMKTGLSLVSMNYSDEKKNYNLCKDVYLRKKYLEAAGAGEQFRTKIELACAMLESLLEAVPQILEQNPAIIFDSWFLSHVIVSLLNRHQLKYVSRAKLNRVIEGLEMNLKEYGENVLKPSDFRRYTVKEGGVEKVFYSYTTILPLSKLGDVKVVFIKKKETEELSCVVVSNDLRRSSEELISIYKTRWSIETDYKTSKQHLGLADFHVRKKQGILRYLTLSFVVSTYLEYCKLMGLFGRSFGKEVDVSTKGKAIRAYQHILFERFVVWLEVQFSSGRKWREVLSFFRGPTTRHPKCIQFVRNSALLSLKMSAVGC